MKLLFKRRTFQFSYRTIISVRGYRMFMCSYHEIKFIRVCNAVEENIDRRNATTNTGIINLEIKVLF